MKVRKVYKSNRSGHRGVSQHPRTGRYISYISVDGRVRWLGTFAQLEEAVAARKAAEEHHGMKNAQANTAGPTTRGEPNVTV